MKIRTFASFAFAALFAFTSSADIDVSHSDNDVLIKHALTLNIDDAVIVRTKSGPIAFVRFLSLKTNEVSFLWCYIDSSPQTQCSERLQKVALRAFPGQQRVTELPEKKRTKIETGIAADAQIRVGDILATLSARSNGEFCLEYYRELAQLDFLPARKNLAPERE